MSTLPKVIGFIPAYKSEKFILETLQALSNQTYPNFEIWICDDASPDRTFQICKDFCEKDFRFKLIQNQSNLGWWKTWTRMWDICASESKYSFFHPHDDTPYPNFISDQVDLLEKNQEAVLCVPGMQNNYDGKKSESFILQNLCTSKSPSERISQLVSWEIRGWWAAVHGLHRSEYIKEINTGEFLRFGEKEFALDLIWLIKLTAKGPFIASDRILFEKHYSTSTLSGSWKYNFKNRAAVYFAMAEEVIKLNLPLKEKASSLKAIGKKSFDSLRRKINLSK